MNSQAKQRRKAMFEILQKDSLNPTVTRMVIDAPYVAKKGQPGQFIILRVNENGERIPLTIADADPATGRVTIIYQIVGATTYELDQLNVGDCLQDFVGPLGKPSELEGLKKVAVVGGGVGCAIAYPIAKKLKEGENDCNYIDTSPKELCQPKKNKSNINNISEENIDIDEIKSSKDLDESESNSESESHKFEDEEVNLIKKIKKKIEKMKKIKYSINYPKRNSMNNSAPIIPYPYNYIYNIDVNSSQKLIGKKKYYEPKENNILGDNCSYKKIEVLPTVEINHIHSNNLIISGKTVLCSTLSRYRNKFITFLYYKPF